MKHPLFILAVTLAEMAWPLVAGADFTGFENGSPQLKPGKVYLNEPEPAKTKVGVACGQELEMPSEEEPPALNDKLREFQSRWPQLQNKDDVALACLQQDSECETKNAEDVSAGSVRETNMKTRQDKVNFHYLVTDTAFETGRDEAATASQNGFLRRVDSMQLLYNVQKHEKFHFNAAGVDEVTLKLFKDEELKQRALISTFELMEEELGRIPSEKKTLEILAFYQEEARKSAKNLGLIICEAERMAKFNYDAEEKLKALHGAADPRGFSGISGELKYPPQIRADGDISGLPETQQRAIRMIAIQAEILEPVSAYRNPA